MSNQSQPAAEPKMQLYAIRFMPQVTVPSGGLPESSIDGWNADKHARIKAVEQKNGDVLLYHPNGCVSTLSPWMIAYRVHRPERK